MQELTSSRIFFMQQVYTHRMLVCARLECKKHHFVKEMSKSTTMGHIGYRFMI